VTARFRFGVSWALALTLSLSAAGARAGEGTSAIDEVIDILCESEGLGAQRCQELRDQAAREREGSAAPAVAADEPTWKAYWNNGFRVERSDKVFKLKFGGRIMNDYAVVALSHGAEDAANAIDSSGNVKQGFGTEFRRARVFFEGEMWEHLYFKSQLDFAGGEVVFKDVYMGLTGIPADLDFRVGHFYEPFSLETQTSSKYITFLERGLPIVMAPERNTGFMLRRMESRWSAAAGFFVDTGESGDRDPMGLHGSDNYNVTARVTGLPVWKDDGATFVHLGAAYSYLFRDEMEPMNFATRPEVHLTSNLLDSGDIPAHWGERLGLEAAGVFGPASVQGEWIGQWASMPGSSGANLSHGFYVQGSYFLTGEHRVYDPKNGVFGRVSPKNNFNLGHGGCGAWELAERFSWIDLDDAETSRTGGTLWDLTSGVNWYLFPNARVMLNYVYGQLTDGGHAHAVQTRFQLDF
jgi:phosphate-selective porin OprO/OprP